MDDSLKFLNNNFMYEKDSCNILSIDFKNCIHQSHSYFMNEIHKSFIDSNRICIFLIFHFHIWCKYLFILYIALRRFDDEANSAFKNFISWTMTLDNLNVFYGKSIFRGHKHLYYLPYIKIYCLVAKFWHGFYAKNLTS